MNGEPVEELRPGASIVIVGWRDAPYLTACVESVLSSVPAENADVLVVLNEPAPGLAPEIRSRFPDIRVWTFRFNLGFGGAVNFAASRAEREFLVLLNDDSLVEPGWLEALMDTARRRPDVGAVGSTFLNVDGSLQEAGSVLWSTARTWAVGTGGNVAQWDFERRVDYCSGGSLLVRLAAWRALGGVDDRYYPAYYEDVDLCLRLDEAGWQTWYQPASRVRHVRGGSTSNWFRAFLDEVNHARFTERWAHVLAEREEPGNVEAAAWKAMRRDRRVLVIDDLVPTESMGSGFGRARDMLIELSAAPDLHVAFHPRNGVGRGTSALTSHGVRIVQDLASHLDTPGVDYDVVVVSRPHNGEIFRDLLNEKLPHAKRIYDAEALYHRRVEQEVLRAPEGPQRDALQAQADAMRTLEESLAAEADLVVCISEQEAAHVRPHTQAPVVVIEALLSAPEVTTAPFIDRHDIGFIAGWLAGPGAPNSGALLWFAREVLPLVQSELPSCRLLVTGASPPDDVRWMDGPDVRFIGMLPELRSFYDHIRVAISPTLVGAGVKLKTVEAVQYGVPVVATSEGAAGLSDEWHEAVSVADDPRAFADAVIALVRDRRTWERRRNRGLELVSAGRQGNSDIRMWPKVVRQVDPRHKGS
ncbi:glycosyltransferase [Modestobacter lacusdianchii]